MKIGECRDLGADELKQRVKDLDDQLFRLRIQKSMGQLEAAHKLKAVRRDLARVPWLGRLSRQVFEVARRLVDALETNAPPRDREVEAAKAKARAAERFGTR